MRRRHGFTLFELLMVSVVMGVLASVLLPALARSRESARGANCMANLMQIGMALRIYAEENDRQLPWSGGKGNADCLSRLYPDYVADLRLFCCPSASSDNTDYSMGWGGPPEEGRRRFFSDTSLGGSGVRGSYDYFGVHTATPITLPHPSRPTPRIPVMWDMNSGTTMETAFDRSSPRNHNGGGNVLWLDGTAESMRSETWAGPNVPVAVQGIEYEFTEMPAPEETPPPPQEPSVGLMERLRALMRPS